MLSAYFSHLSLKSITGILYSLSIIFFVDDSVVLNVFTIMIVQEFYVSYFYVAKKNDFMFFEREYPILYYMLLSLLIFVSILIFFPANQNSIYLAALLFLFPIYASMAPFNEKQDITRWVLLENTAGVVAVIFVSICLFLSWCFNLGFDSAALLRLPIMYMLVIVLSFFSYNFTVFRNHISSKKNIGCFIRFIDIVVILAVFKLVFFNSGRFDGSESGEAVKYFIFLYDAISVVIALFIRRSIALGGSVACVSATLLVNSGLMVFYILTYFVISKEGFVFNFLLSIESVFVFISIAVTYNLTMIFHRKMLWLYRLLYVSLIFMIYFDLSYLVLALLSVNFFLSFYKYLMDRSSRANSFIG